MNSARNTRTGNWLSSAAALLLSVLYYGAAKGALAQASAVSYPSNSLIAANVLDPSHQANLETLINAKLTTADYSKLRSKICPQSITRSPLNNESMKSSISENKVELTTELLFEKNSGASATLPEKFSFLLDFSKTRVLLQHLSARFTSDAAGFSVPLPLDLTRGVRLEGTMGVDLLVMVPPVRECGVQAVVVCPRQYEKIDKLVPSPYALKGWRTLVNAKADGVTSAQEGTPAKVMASILTSSPINPPQEWFDVSTGARTVTATKKLVHNRTQPQSLPAFVPVSELPITAAVESRVDIGSESAPLRTSSKRMTVEISTFNLVDKPGVGIGKSVYFIQGGACYLVSQWSDEVV